MKCDIPRLMQSCSPKYSPTPTLLGTSSLGVSFVPGSGDTAFLLFIFKRSVFFHFDHKICQQIVVFRYWLCLC